MVALDPSFCPQCGTALQSRHLEDRDRPYCATCDRVVWQNPVPTAGVAVVDDGRVLLVKREHEPDAGCWGIPAGFLEVEESAPEAAARELAEETGLVVAPEALTLVSVGQMEHPTGRMLVTVGFCVARSETSGVPRAGSDALDVRFVSPESIDGGDSTVRGFDRDRIRTAIDRVGGNDAGSV